METILPSLDFFNTDVVLVFIITLGFIAFMILFGKHLPISTVRKFLSIALLFTKNAAIRKHMNLVIEITKILEKIEKSPATSTDTEVRVYVGQVLQMISQRYTNKLLDQKTKEAMIDAIMPIIANKESVEQKAVEIVKMLLVRFKK